MSEIDVNLERCRRARNAAEDVGDVQGWMAQVKEIDDLLEARHAAHSQVAAH